jgi:hypothetical protein
MIFKIKHLCDDIQNVKSGVDILQDIGLEQTLTKVLHEARLDFPAHFLLVTVVVFRKGFDQVLLIEAGLVILVKR